MGLPGVSLSLSLSLSLQVAESIGPTPGSRGSCEKVCSSLPVPRERRHVSCPQGMLSHTLHTCMYVSTTDCINAACYLALPTILVQL